MTFITPRVSAPRVFDRDEKSGTECAGDEAKRGAANLFGIERRDGAGRGKHHEGDAKQQRALGERLAGLRRPDRAERRVASERGERDHRGVWLPEIAPWNTAPEARDDQHQRKDQQQERREARCDCRQQRCDKEQNRNERTTTKWLCIMTSSASRHADIPAE
jgi:hypothetical protein